MALYEPRPLLANAEIRPRLGGRARPGTALTLDEIRGAVDEDLGISRPSSRVSRSVSIGDVQSLGPISRKESKPKSVASMSVESNSDEQDIRPGGEAARRKSGLAWHMASEEYRKVMEQDLIDQEGRPPDDIKDGRIAAIDDLLESVHISNTCDITTAPPRHNDSPYPSPIVNGPKTRLTRRNSLDRPKPRVTFNLQEDQWPPKPSRNQRKPTLGRRGSLPVNLVPMSRSADGLETPSPENVRPKSTVIRRAEFPRIKRRGSADLTEKTHVEDSERKQVYILHYGDNFPNLDVSLEVARYRFRAEF